MRPPRRSFFSKTQTPPADVTPVGVVPDGAFVSLYAVGSPPGPPPTIATSQSSGAPASAVPLSVVPSWPASAATGFTSSSLEHANIPPASDEPTTASAPYGRIHDEIMRALPRK